VQRDTNQMEDCSIKQEQNDNKIYLVFKTRGERRATKGDTRRRPIKYNDVKGLKEENGGKKVDQF